jgi:hypothetical protein
VAALPVAAALAFWSWRESKKGIALLIRRVALPLGLTLAVGAAVMMLYFYRTTGHPLRLPYSEGFKQYMYRRFFVWQKNRPRPQYNHPEMAALYRLLERSHVSWAGKVKLRIEESAKFFLHPVLVFPLLMLPFVFRDKRFRFLLFALAVFLAGLLVEEWSWPHYAGPAACLIAAVLMQSIRHMRTITWKGRRIGRFAALLLFAMGFVIAGRRGELLGLPTVNFPPPWEFERARIEQTLRSSGGRHVVVVRYSSHHNAHHEWVYNAADIENAPVIWAREMPDMGPLLGHFQASRTIWLVEADQWPPFLRAYPQRLTADGKKSH